MNNYLTSLSALLLWFAVISAADDLITVHLVTTNDLHGVIGEQYANFMNPEYPPQLMGGAAIYKYVQDLKTEVAEAGDELLILDGGNFFQGHPLGIFDGGRTMLEWMNRVGYSALVPGQYDFVLGAANLNELAEAAAFPFLTSNLICEDCPLDSDNLLPYIIREVQGVKIGILGIVSSDIVNTVLRQNIPGISALTEVQALQKWVPELRNSGCNVIICLTSAGEPYDREEEYQLFLDSMATTPEWNPRETPLNALQMSYFADGVDVIISGGVSRSYPTPWYDPTSHTYLFQNYGGGTEIGHIKLLIDRATERFVGYESVIDGRVTQTLLADDFQPDFAVNDWIREREGQALASYYSQGIDLDDNSRKIRPPDKLPNITSNWDVPSINTDDRIEIITWNCEFFPHNWDETVTALAEVVTDLDPDLIAFQEIRYAGWFSKLMDQIPAYDFIISRQSSFMDMAIIYKRDLFELERQVEIFAEDDYNFAGRPPLQGDFTYINGSDTTRFSIVNLHMKCCDSGLDRRRKAVAMLHEYLAEAWDSGNRNFIVLGDWNDDLKDADNAHGFHPFFADERFYFVNEKIVYDVSQASYPKEPYVSFLDHILVTEQFVPRTNVLKVQTLLIGEYMGGYEVYEEYISDHRPVLLAFPVP
ncbi:MAG: endonuclease/exonuclease/phosphatase family protein [Candidatus Marinimicrobia bacterium]|nr:endonuclease/exonuclease/phosphatase family protein [Candidatus Neomarinimicrobiota bacterium]